MHLQLKNQNCHVCTKSFGAKSSLLTHIRSVHEKRDRVECNLCTKTFGSKCSQRQHIETVHQKIKKFVCRICNNKFAHSGSLKEHIVKTHGEGLPCQAKETSIFKLDKLDYIKADKSSASVIGMNCTNAQMILDSKQNLEEPWTKVISEWKFEKRRQESRGDVSNRWKKFMPRKSLKVKLYCRPGHDF